MRLRRLLECVPGLSLETGCPEMDITGDLFALLVAVKRWIVKEDNYVGKAIFFCH